MKLPQLSNRPGLSSHYEAFLNELSQCGFAGDIETSYSDRLVYATDNSIYQVLPQAVVYPRSGADIDCLLALVSQDCYQQIVVAPRGGGTGTNGQSLTSGIVVELSRHMNQILEINLNEKWARVQAGVVLDQLNKELRVRGYFFAPDLSPSNRATIGGMVNTDACGKGSRIYGKTSEHILELSLHALQGLSWRSKTLSQSEYKIWLLQSPEKLRSIMTLVNETIQLRKEQIASRFPKLTRFLSGYNLAQVFDAEGHFHLNKLIAGSEGTLALVSEIKLRLTPIPRHKALFVIKYENFLDSLQAARELISCDPAAVETIDDRILGLARSDTIWHRVEKFFQAPGDEKVASINLVELVAESAVELEKKVSQVQSHLEQVTHGSMLSFDMARSGEEIAALWDLRKKGVGLLGNQPGLRRPIPFVEDTVVPPEHLADYIREFRVILDKYQLSYGMFGHVDVGCLHVRPALDLKQQQDENLIRLITDQVRDLVIKYGGVLWGEHGKGFRSEYMRDFFGPELFADLQKIKGSFDPRNQLNPGKIVSPPGKEDQIPRIDAVPMRGHHDRQIAPDVMTAYAPAINCNGNGACFNFDHDAVMCPSYKYTRQRLHSPKGRASIMREWLKQLEEFSFRPLNHEKLQQAKKLDFQALISRIFIAPWRRLGQFATLTLQKESSPSRDDVYDFSHEVYAAMDGCLSCKACTSQCPIKVDIPELKARFLYHYHQQYQRPLSDYAVASAERLHMQTFLQKSPWLYNCFVRWPLTRGLLEAVTQMKDPPLLSSPSISKLIKRGGFKTYADLKTSVQKAGGVEQIGIDRRVILLPDAVSALYEADLVIDVIKAMETLGFDVYLAPLLENGKAKHVKGFLPEFRDAAARMNKFLCEAHSYKIPIVGIDPAVTLTYREEYKAYLGEARGDYEVLMLHEWIQRYCLSRKGPAVDIMRQCKEVLSSMSLEKRKALTYQHDHQFVIAGHCGEQAACSGFADIWIKFFDHLGLKLAERKVGCCGMAGAFGHEKRHQRDSFGIYQQSWGPAIEALKDEEKENSTQTKLVMLTTGSSCRSQVKRYSASFAEHRLKHPLQVVSKVLKEVLESGFTRQRQNKIQDQK